MKIHQQLFNFIYMKQKFIALFHTKCKIKKIIQKLCFEHDKHLIYAVVGFMRKQFFQRVKNKQFY